MCRKDVAYKNFKYLTYSTPNKAARALMPKEYRNNPVLFPSRGILEKSEAMKDLGPKGDELYGKCWKIFKAH